MWKHEHYHDLIVEICGNDGDDAPRWLEKIVKDTMDEAARRDASSEGDDE